MSISTLRERCLPYLSFVDQYRSQEIYPYFRPIEGVRGPEVLIQGSWRLSVASNDYLGLSHDPRVAESAVQASRQWGTGLGGSRFLCGNLSLYQELEGRLAAWVGKKTALVHATGFSANLGAIPVLLGRGDIVLCDRRVHASVLEGCGASGARLVPFAHNDASSAAGRLARARQKMPQGLPLLITEGVFSMDGDLAPLPDLLALRERAPDLLFYLDDAHGLGVMGPGGRGSAAHFGVTEGIDFIMGTFSKSLASVGGFIASDDLTVMDFMRHQSRSLMFSAALPAANLAAAMKALEIIQGEPQHVERLWRISTQARQALQGMGLDTGGSSTPIIPVKIGSTMLAALVARDLLELGVFAPPAIFPAVAQNQALIRVAFNSAFSDEQVERVLSAFAEVARRHGLGQDGPGPQA